jgi:hypothetical protein
MSTGAKVGVSLAVILAVLGGVAFFLYRRQQYKSVASPSVPDPATEHTRDIEAFDDDDSEDKDYESGDDDDEESGDKDEEELEDVDFEDE